MARLCLEIQNSNWKAWTEPSAYAGRKGGEKERRERRKERRNRRTIQPLSSVFSVHALPALRPPAKARHGLRYTQCPLTLVALPKERFYLQFKREASRNGTLCSSDLQAHTSTMLSKQFLTSPRKGLISPGRGIKKLCLPGAHYPPTRRSDHCFLSSSLCVSETG